MPSFLRPSTYIPLAAGRITVRNVSLGKTLTDTPYITLKPGLNPLSAMPCLPTALPAIVALLLAGCAPYPHQAYVVPDIQGSLSVGGAPVQGAVVMMGTAADQQAPCNNAVEVTTTDAQGRFHIAARSETDYLVSAINLPSTQGQFTQICFQKAGEPVRYGGGFFSWRSKPAQFSILCDPALPAQRSPTGLDQICREAAP